MDFNKLPMGFGMALSRNFDAMNAYNALPEDEKQALAAKAQAAQSEEEMHALINTLIPNYLL